MTDTIPIGAYLSTKSYIIYGMPNNSINSGRFGIRSAFQEISLLNSPKNFPSKYNNFNLYRHKNYRNLIYCQKLTLSLYFTTKSKIYFPNMRIFNDFFL